MSTISDPHLSDGARRPGEVHPQYRGGSTTVPSIAVTLNRSGPRQSSGVLRSGGDYIHCGEPMHAAGSGLRSVYAPMTTEPAPTGQTSARVLAVYLRARVLRCGCGFQMEIPE
ncbi:hypothetical protein ACVWY0_002514 [Arthrobacter sp. UYNi723]